ncbi:MAG: T9SS type A sorting domain-containing protein [FCB group bacterium]|nr:T9SS type A sorting domain-containing protein [FCB group bacterium]
MSRKHILSIILGIVFTFGTIFSQDGPPEEVFAFNISTLQAFYFIQTATTNGVVLTSEDWVAAYNHEGTVCVGSTQWQGEFTSLGLMGDDGSPFTTGYMQTDEIPIFKIYDASAGLYLDAVASQDVPWENLGTPFIDSLSATFDLPGCMDMEACNYNPDATQDDGSCLQVDCAGDCGGTAVEDMCGTCDADPGNDCVQDCLGVWGGTAVVDDCGVCEGNNADMDCAGVCFGDAVEDMCGTCDNDPANDCVQDCLGEWGGTAVEDMCGTCDADPGNDCVQDCLGVWGGTAVVDDCGVCDGNNADMDDCGVCFGGNADMDDCGVCFGGNADMDCNGDCGGTAFVNECGCVGGETGLAEFWCNPPVEEFFSFNQSTQQANYFFITATINGYELSTDDWIAAFNGDVCVGARQWNGPYTDIPIMGDDGSEFTTGYMNVGQVPTFMIWNASTENYLDATASEEVPWDVFITPVLDYLMAFDPDEPDCAGEMGGTAVFDDCGECSGGSTGLDYNWAMDCTGECFGTAVVDCAGVCEGTAYLDDCGECVAGTTGQSENWAMDCNGECYGEAFIDDCGICSEGGTDHAANSDQDCNGDCFGEAAIDDCGVCAGGLTGFTPNADVDDCGVCFGTNDCYGCLDPNALNYDPEALLMDSSCQYDNMPPVEEYFDYSQSTMQANYFFEIATLNDVELSTDDWIGAFKDGVCVGARHWNGPFTDIAIMGDDGNPWTAGYMQAGDIPYFVIYSTSHDTYYSATASENVPWENFGTPVLDWLRADWDISGCMNPEALNYDPWANIDNNWCWIEGSPPPFFAFGQSTLQAFYFIGMATIGGVELDPEDWIGAFNGSVDPADYDGTIPAGMVPVGAASWSGAYTDIPVMGDDGTPWTAGYMTDGVEPIFMIYDASADVLYLAEASENFGWYNLGTFTIMTLTAMLDDCTGLPGGDAIIDDCGQCSGGTTGQEINWAMDCNGVCFGEAFVDDCNECVGGDTGMTENWAQDDCGVCFGENADKDCNGDCFGEAFTDSCGECVGGNTGMEENWAFDCNGDCFGEAFTDSCGECVGGNTGMEENWAFDCNGDCFGTAFIDDCGTCSEGDTGHAENSDMDCNGDCFGEAVENDCGCVLGNTGLEELWCYGCTDDTAMNYGSDFTIDDGSCLYPPTEFNFEQSTLQAFYFINDASIGGFELSEYDWIGAFNGDVCVGAAQWAGSETPVPAMGDEEEGYTDGYMTVGDVPTFVIWDADQNIFYQTVVTASGSLAWENLGLYPVDFLDAIMPDCAGVFGGDAYVDNCGDCVGGTTGLIACEEDCAGTWGGSAYLDMCGTCDDDPENDCMQDCNGDWGGTAFIDDCGYCVGGDTGLEANWADMGCGCDAPAPVTYCSDFDGDGLGNPGTETSYCEGEVPADGWVADCTDESDDGEAMIYFDSVDTSSPDFGTLYLAYTSDVDVFGFQFDLEGFTMIDGLATNGGFQLQVNPDAGHVILFSISGDFYPAGSDIFAEIHFEYGPSGDACIANAILAGSVGHAPATTIGDCIYVEEPPADCNGVYYGDALLDECGVCDNDPDNDNACFGCTDENAINYDPAATIDDGSCYDVNNLPFAAPASTVHTHYRVAMSTLDDVELSEFDWIAAYKGDLLVGAAQWAGPLTVVVVMGDDGTPETDGFMTPGDIPSWKIYDASAMQYTTAVASQDFPWEHFAVFDVDLISAGTLDCAGVSYGSAYIDMCDVCVGGSTGLEACVQDCAGDWGGDAVADMCGTCDNDPNNDCIQDCNGDWGGSAYVDMCGVCDADAENDCVQDCNGDWGGLAEMDPCGNCDADPLNDCYLNTRQLDSGWNWISLNLINDDMTLNSVLASIGADGLYIKSQGGTFAQYVDGIGWFGTLTDLNNTAMFKLEMSVNAQWDITGFPVDPAATPIDLNFGWNWVGFTPQNPGDINTALASIGNSGNYIKAKNSAFAQYIDGFGWFGILDNLEPLNGYMLRMDVADQLFYPDFGGGLLSENTGPVLADELSRAVADWVINPAEYEFSGSVTASVRLNGSVVGSENDLLAAFVGNECRGVVHGIYFPGTDTYIYPLMISSNETDGEEVTFRYYDSEADVVYSYDETVQFTNDMVTGDLTTPFVLEENSILGIDENLPAEYALSSGYPNPFNPSTTLEYSMKNPGNVNITVYDMMGRTVDVLINDWSPAGNYSVTWNADSQPSGIYLVKMTSSNFATVQKVMLIK